MQKALKNKAVIFAVMGSFFSLIGALIFNLLPNSELANGIQYSGEDALWALVFSPVLFFIGGAGFITSMLLDMKNWKKTLHDIAIYIYISAFAFAVIFNFAVSLSYFVTQLSLGFVAPFDGLVYEKAAIVMIIFVIWQFIFSALTVAESLKDSK